MPDRTTLGGRMSVAAPVAWTTRAACRGLGTHLMGADRPESSDQRDEREDRAKQICAPCPVRLDCLEYALRVREHLGVWGGLSGPERRAILDHS
jgi:WhiB family transcriptional regulator, redox-sensing transcriptional regulator